MKIEPGCLIELEYELRNSKGEVIETSKSGSLMTYLHGNEEIPPRLEQSLAGHDVGEKVVVTLPPGDAYGEFNPDGIVAVPRSEFPEDAEIVPGDWVSIEVSGEEGEEKKGEMEMRVIEIAPEAITLDANHPLAGEEITFDLKVASVRKATAEEIESRNSERHEDEEEEPEGEESEEEEA
ncbi:MAG: peptidylprolyl isomerase [Planctomycetes bacterium]|nr:peptidylprolyl isomerase [Planctomycetota bacterium]